MSTESFKDLFEESIAQIEMQTGSIIPATVLKIDQNKGFVSLNAGLKSEGIISINEFLNSAGELEVAEGDSVEVALEAIEDGYGETILSREKAKREEAWIRIFKLFEAGQTVMGKIDGKVKGGFTVALDQVRAFLPGSLVDVRPVRDTGPLEGIELEFKVIKMDKKRNNIVVSRRAVVEQEYSEERQALLDSLSEGQELEGVVKNLTDYGAFVDLGGIDGLLHITDISWKRVKHPSEVLNVGEKVMVKILSFDRERKRVSLGMKQLANDPWADIVGRYPEGTQLSGRVTNITDYGCFVEIETGVEGLVHMSEMDWTNKNIHPSKVVQLGDEVSVMVLEIDQDRRRISLGMKQTQTNPWQAFAEQHQKGDKITGTIRSITDFGIFIGLPGNIDGLVHLSDISWSESGEESVKNYKKSQEVEAVIVSIDSERERISLGIKQLSEDDFGSYVSLNTRGSTVKGKITEVTAEQVTVDLAPEVTGVLKAADVSSERVNDLSTLFNVGDELEAKVSNVDRKSRTVNLSVRALSAENEAEALRKYARGGEEDTTGATLGDILKEQIKPGDQV